MPTWATCASNDILHPSLTEVREYFCSSNFQHVVETEEKWTQLQICVSGNRSVDNRKCAKTYKEHHASTWSKKICCNWVLPSVSPLLLPWLKFHCPRAALPQILALVSGGAPGSSLDAGTLLVLHSSSWMRPPPRRPQGPDEATDWVEVGAGHGGAQPCPCKGWVGRR